MKFVKHNHPKDLITGDMEEGMKLIPTIEPKTFSEAFNDECWKNAMKEELDQIEKK